MLCVTASVLAEDVPTAVDPVSKINQAIEDQWNAQEVTPAPIADDAMFARRLYLDLLGRVPTVAELVAFTEVDEQSSIQDKRERLIDELLTSDEHAVHLAEVLDAILIGRTGPGKYKQREQAGWFEYLTNAIRENRPWNDVAAEILLARPTTPEQRGATWYLYARNDEAQQIAEAVSKDFFGVRIDCAQCHDHPLAYEIEQRHYWGLVAFLTDPRTSRPRPVRAWPNRRSVDFLSLPASTAIRLRMIWCFSAIEKSPRLDRQPTKNKKIVMIYILK
jgi:hypothetical protein